MKTENEKKSPWTFICKTWQRTISNPKNKPLAWACFTCYCWTRFFWCTGDQKPKTKNTVFFVFKIPQIPKTPVLLFDLSFLGVLGGDSDRWYSIKVLCCGEWRPVKAIETFLLLWVVFFFLWGGAVSLFDFFVVSAKCMVKSKKTYWKAKRWEYKRSFSGVHSLSRAIYDHGFTVICLFGFQKSRFAPRAPNTF